MKNLIPKSRPPQSRYDPPPISPPNRQPDGGFDMCVIESSDIPKRQSERGVHGFRNKRIRGTGGPPVGFSLLESQFLLHDIQRPLFDLLVDSADVLPEDADADELHSTEEEDAYDRRCEAGHLFVHREEADDVKHAQAER